MLAIAGSWGGYMKCPKCRAETALTALECPGCKLKTPRGRYEAELAEERAPRKFRFRIEGKPLHIKPWVSWVVIVASVMLCIVGSYVSFMYFSEPPRPQPPLHQVVLDKLRLSPSNHSWLTVEESLENEVEKSQKEGRLVEAEGWDVRQTEDGSFLISFTFQEKDNRQQRAVWNVNPMTNSLVPQTDLAEFILKNTPTTP